MSGIEAVTRELCLTVQEQARVWRRLLDLSLAQLDALKSQNVHGVHAILQELEVTMLERSRTEVRRGILLQQAATMLDVPVEAITRDVLVEHVDPQLAASLVEAAEELRALVVELDAVVGRNTVLLEQELAIIEVMVRGATVDSSARVTYGKHGMQHEAPRLRLLDAQV
ncbi:MAG: hypothetical protein JWM86_1533 [Thermoleophilia bacterium]|nr:hypothetical protein [Thermoleophilia bacterium]